MDLLKPKNALIGVCLLGAALISADENLHDDEPKRLEQTAENVQASKSTNSSVEKEPTPEPTGNKTPNRQATDLKPLELKERIRAHANIDLPQDI
ncbi:MAG: hypothetical protein OXG25_11835 [Gammaproteobacteria bacterium]|nr:hypothetical protein [Gammaproteobacteria bacterium]